MKRILAAAFLAVFCLVLPLAPAPAQAQAYPRPVGFVNDFANLLSRDGKNQLEARLAKLEQDTSAQLAVVTIDTLDGAVMEDYAAGLFKDWGIGQKGKDNGVLFIMSVQDKKMKIEVGYGLEPIITDGRAGRILDEFVVPSFRDGDYEQGITDGVIALEGYIRDGNSPSAIEDNPIGSAMKWLNLPLWIIIVLGIMTIYVLGFMARTRSIWLGGIWGFILGIVLGFGVGTLLMLILLPVALAVVGTLLDILLSRNYQGRSTSGMSTGWFSTRGGFSGPAGGTWFGGSGGGSGFGGGGSGGGGAGRGW